MSPTKTVVVTGFEPFGGEARNPSQEIAQALDGRIIERRRVIGRVLPCVFGASAVVLRQQLRRWRPELVICLGLAGGRSGITPERVAVNVDDARIPDNAGQSPIDRPVVRGGPVGYFSTLPIKAIVSALRARGFPAVVSQTAGTFVCNHVFYALMHQLRAQRRVRGGFIHVPFASGQGPESEPHLELERMIEAVALAIEVSLRTRRDARTEGGHVR